MSARLASRLPARKTTWVLAAALATGAVAAGAWLILRQPPVGALRIGYRAQPPIYFAPAGKPPEGLAVDVLATAAARLGIAVHWTQITGSSTPALLAGTIDVWPTSHVRAGVPGVRITEPWLESTVFVISKPGVVRDLDGLRGKRVALIDVAYAEEAFASALRGATRITKLRSSESLQAVCSGEADATFIEGRQVQAMLLERPPGCEGIPLAFGQSPVAVLQYGIGSTLAAEREAKMLRAEVSRMSEDGTLATIHARWSLATTNETRQVYALQQARQRTRWSEYGIGAMTVALLISLWQARRNRHARRLAERASAAMEDHARQQERYRLLFERNVAGVVRTTVDGEILDCNPAFARMLGYGSTEELLAVPAWQLYTDESDRKAVLQRLQEERAISHYENHVRRKDGSFGWLLESVTMIEQGPGQPVILESTVIDITEQRRLEDQYRQAQKLESIGRLAGGVAHDFNNLLTAINGYSELVLTDLSDSSPLRGPLVEIRKAGQRAASLTQQLLAFSRKQLLQPVVLDVNAVIADAEKLLKRVIGEDIDLVTRLDPGLGSVRADQGQLHQVVMNLAVNARDAMPDGGRLSVETSNEDVLATDVQDEPDGVIGPCVRVRVSDTGHGMDAETRRRVFEPFFTTKDVGKGTGLGLSTVYGIVKQSGGHIVLNSRPGEGTTFDIYLPRVAEAKAPDGSSRIAVLAEAAGIVLVVEDQEEVRRLATEVLSRQGFRVFAAPDARGAFEICRRETAPIELLLVDVVMPGLSGPALAARLASDYPLLKVLFMSGYINPALEGRPFLRKPFTPSQLVSKVSEMLEGRAGAA